MINTLIALEMISRIELRYKRFFTNAAVVKIAVIMLIIKVRKVIAKVSLTAFSRPFGIWSISSRLSTITAEAKSITAAIIISAINTELKYFDAFSTLPLLYSIEINLPDIEFSATVTIVAYWTKLFASPIKPYVSLPSSRTKIGVRIKLMPVLMINETTAASILTVICLLFDISFMPVNQSFTKAWGRL